VVVLMLENRSFDHMLGFLDHGGLQPISGPANPADPTDPASPSYRPFALTDQDTLTHDPKHSYDDVMRQLTALDGPWTSAPVTNTGFAWNYAAETGGQPQEVMGCHTPDRLPVMSALAREYAVCSRWFGSVPSQTWPNRLFAHAATSDGEISNVVRLYENRTIFEALSTAGHSWNIYAGDIPQVAAFPELWWHDGGFRFHRIGDFIERAREGRLAEYSFIEPRHFGGSCNSQHPLSPVALGEALIRDVYEAIASNRDGWESTMLLITYDEHGGFFDHVPPPHAAPPIPVTAADSDDFGFGMLGPRVPAIVVSPYVAAGTVDETVLDHTSICATLRSVFDFTEALTDRDANANGVFNLLSEEAPREPIALPAVVRLREAELEPSDWAAGLSDDGTIVLNDLQSSLVDLAGLVDAQAAERDESFGPTIASSARPPFRTEGEMGEFIEAFRTRLGY
jgi:phospholipase C